MLSCIKDNTCWDSAEYVEEVTGYRPPANITLKELEDLFKEEEVCLWNYPLTEIEHIIENELEVVLVRFPEYTGGYEYRFCEISNED